MDATSRTFSVAGYEVHSFLDGIYSSEITDLAHSDPVGRDKAVANWGRPTFEIDVNCFGLAGRDGPILIDAGTGEHWGPAYGKAPAAMREAGFAPDEIGTILLTHIHGDHALGLLDGEAARYPRAHVHLPRADADYYADPTRFEKPPEGCRTLDRLKRAYGSRLVLLDPGHALPGIEAIALPGHTPGHTGYLIRDAARTLLFWGDVVHIEALQMADPLLGFDYDVDFQAAQRSRQFALDAATREGWFVAGAHVRGIRQVERRDNGFAFR